MAAQKFIDLREQLSEDMRHGHKAVLHLNGLIRKLHSLRAFVQMKNEESKKQINEYVTKLSESLLEFRAEMLMELDAVQKDKFEHICQLRDSYESDIETLSRLFEEAERYLQFDRRLHTERDRNNVKKLLDGIRELLDPPDQQEMADILHFEFRPSISVKDMGPHFLGTMETCLNKPENVDITNDNAMLSENPYAEPAVKNRKTTVLKPKGREMGTQTEAPCRVQPKPQIVQGGLYADVSFPQQPRSQQPCPVYGQTPAAMFYPCVTPLAPMYRPVRPPPPGFTGNTPGFTGNTGFAGNAPGFAGNAPGFASNTPGFASNTPGISGSTPGFSSNASTFSGNAPGFAGNAPTFASNAPGFAGNAPLVYGSQVLSPVKPDSCSQAAYPLNSGLGVPANMSLDMQKKAEAAISDLKSMINQECQKASCRKEIHVLTPTENVREPVKDMSASVRVDTVTHTHMPNIVQKNTDSGVTEYQKESVVKNAKIDLDCYIVEPVDHGVIDLTESHKPDNSEKRYNLEKPEDRERPDESSSSLDSGIVSPPGLAINLKEKLADILLPLKPLRKPLRLPKLATDKLEAHKTRTAEPVEEHSVVELESRRNVNEGVGDVCDHADSRRNGPNVDSQNHEALGDGEQPVISDTGKEGSSFRIAAEMRTSTPLSKENRLEEGTSSSRSTEQDRPSEGIKSCGVRKDLASSLAKPAFETQGKGDAPDSRLSASIDASPFRPRAVSFKASVNEPTGLNAIPSTPQTASCKATENRSLGEILSATKPSGSVSCDSAKIKTDIPDVCDIPATVAVKAEIQDDERHVSKDPNNNNSCSQTHNTDKAMSENAWNEHSSGYSDIKPEPAEIKQEVAVITEGYVWTEEGDSARPGGGDSARLGGGDSASVKPGSGAGAVPGDWDDGVAKEQQGLEAAAASKSAPGGSCEKKANLQKQTRQLAQRVKNFLGEGPSPAANSYSSRLGAVQAHWLTSPGTDLSATYQFQLGTDLNFPIGVTTDHEGNIIMTDTGHGVIKKYDTEGKLLVVIGESVSPPMKRPSAVVVGRNNELFVKDDVCIHMFDRDGLYVTNIGKQALSRPFGLDMTHMGNLITLVTNPRRPTVVHLAPDGEQYWSYVYTPLLNAPYGSKCRFLAVADNSLIVSDLGLSKIYLTTLQGVYMAEFGTHGSGPLDFLEPSGVTVDNYGNVLIGDSKNNRIKMYRQNGQYMGKLQLDTQIIRPSGIHLTRDNRLVVVNFLQHHAKVFSLGPESSTSHS